MVTTLTVLKSIHVLSAAFWVGGALTLNVAVVLAGRSEGPEPRIATLRLTRFMGLWVFTPVAVLVLGTGIWLAAEYYDLGDLWISLGIAGWLVAVAVLLAYIVPRAGSMLDALERGDAPAPNRVPLAARFNLVLLSGIVVIMVIRPG